MNKSFVQEVLEDSVPSTVLGVGTEAENRKGRPSSLTELPVGKAENRQFRLHHRLMREGCLPNDFTRLAGKGFTLYTAVPGCSWGIGSRSLHRYQNLSTLKSLILNGVVQSLLCIRGFRI